MDVRCEQCGTEYEFDDALISERGTSVRCTQCGHQFRVFPPQAKLVGPDEWVVITSLGRRIVYRSLRELQNGITRNEVAREDLLARGMAPPRPLGSIAELDPLFSTKSAEERKSNTLTGVAPPPKPTPIHGGQLPPAEVAARRALREHYDTWSGVAPPPNLEQGLAQAASPVPPLRVSGGRTVIGIGTAEQHSKPDHTVPLSAPEPQTPAGLGAPVSLSPDTRSFESKPPEVSESSEATFSPQTSTFHDVVPNEPELPTIPPGANGQGSRLSAPSEPMLEEGDLRKSGRIATLELSSDPKVSSDGLSKPESSIPEAPRPEPSVPAATDEQKRNWEGATGTSATEETAPSWRVKAGKREAPVGASSVTRRDKPTLAVAQTSPPARQHRETSNASNATPPRPKSHTPWGWLFVGALLLLAALYVGMQLPFFAPQDRGKVRTSPEATGALPVQPEPSSAGGEVSPWAGVEEALESGDGVTAARLLDASSPALKATPEYLRYAVLTDSIVADLVWWDIRLLSGSDPAKEASLKQALSERLQSLEGRLKACQAEASCAEVARVNHWALLRMRGQGKDAEIPTQGSVDANGLYQLAMLNWTKSSAVDGKTIERLSKSRSVGGALGPRVTALIVALIDSKKFDEARVEMAKLASAATAHPHLPALNRYLRAADVVTDAGVEKATDAGESPENGDFEASLREPDFRVRLQLAAGCLSRNEITKAQKLYRSVIAQRPNDTEAITGLGDTHLRKRELTQARSSYDRALALNANYLPAMFGAADVRWQSGDRSGAVTLYRRIVERVGDSAGYGQTASARIREFESAAAPSTPADKAPGESGPTGDGAPKPTEAAGKPE